MVESEFTFLQVKVKGLRTHPSKVCEPGFGEPPEAFNSIDMGGTRNKLVLPMIHPKVFPIPDVDEAILASPTVGIDDALQGHLSSNDALKSVFRAIRNDLGVDLSVSLEQAEDDGFSERSAASFPFDPSGSEEGFVHFDLPGQGRLLFTVLGDPFPEAF